MPAEPTDPAELTFRELLTAAIAYGRRPDQSTALGPTTWVALDVVAREHPEATPDQVVTAHDAFLHEHRQACQSEHADPLTQRATEFAEIDNLVAHFRITRPELDPATVGAVIRRIHRDFADVGEREFVTMFVEQEALRRLA